MERSRTHLVVLVAELRRLTRRADRQRRQIEQGTEAWQRWSSTIDEELGVVTSMERAPVDIVTGLATKFRAILWRFRTDEDDILDDGVRRAYGVSVVILCP